MYGKMKDDWYCLRSEKNGRVEADTGVDIGDLLEVGGMHFGVSEWGGWPTFVAEGI